MTLRRTEHLARNEQDTLAVATQLARSVRQGSVIALSGPLGAGKTTFVRCFVQALGGNASDVSSPTFVIAQEYNTPRAKFVHIDAYRLGGASELDTIGWDEMLEARDAIIAVEWAERIEAALPDDVIRITLGHVPGEPSHRAIVITSPAILATIRPCPICAEPTPSDSEFAPFCSQRCRRADLGRWLMGKYSISRPISERDIETQD